MTLEINIDKAEGKNKTTPSVYNKVINFKFQFTIYSGQGILKEVQHIQIMFLFILTCEHPQIEHASLTFSSLLQLVKC